MPDSKITALASIGTGTDPAVDPLVIVDVSDTTMAASGTTKKVTLNNLLACSPTATLASATITGNLTVDTNTLFVDSSTNNVGLGTLAPSGASGRALEIYGGAGQSRLVLKNDTTGSVSTDGSQIALVGSQLVIQNREASEITFETNNSERYRLASDGVATWSNVGGVAGTAMTLNSTGLGVGGSPTRKLSIVGSGATYANINSGDNTSLVGLLLGGTSTPSAGQVIYDNTANSLSLFTSGASRLLIDTSGNVGIGVTPSAWNSSAKAFEIGTAGNSVFSSAATFVEMTNNAYLDSVSNWNRVNTGNAAARFRTSGSGFLWLQAAAGANPITWTTTMQLDSNGNLILQSSATPATLTTNGQLTVNATSNTNLRFSYRGSDGTTRVANITLA